MWGTGTGGQLEGDFSALDEIWWGLRLGEGIEDGRNVQIQETFWSYRQAGLTLMIGYEYEGIRGLKHDSGFGPEQHGKWGRHLMS